MAAALALAGLALVGATPPSALWTADLSRLGQDVWTVAFGPQSNLVFAFAEWGGLVALDPVTGHTVWEAHASGIARAELTEVHGTPEHPNVLDVSGWVGFDAKTGVVLWNRTAATADVSVSPPFSAPPESPADVAATAPAVTRAGASSVKAGSTDGTSVGELAVMTEGSDVLLYDAATGATLWRAPRILGNVACGATLGGGIAAVATSYSEVAPTGPAELVALNASDGTLLWRHSLGVGFTCSGDTRPLISIPATPTSTQRRHSAASGSSAAATVILVPTVNYAGGAMGFGGLLAFDARTGSKMWSAKTRQGAGARWVTAATVPGVGLGGR
jgi:outer membrane protein assembly factor BamB